MVQIIMALAIVAALAYFVLFRTGSQTEGNTAKPYAAEVEKAEQIEVDVLQAKELRDQRINEQTE